MFKFTSRRCPQTASITNLLLKQTPKVSRRCEPTHLATSSSLFLYLYSSLVSTQRQLQNTECRHLPQRQNSGLPYTTAAECRAPQRKRTPRAKPPHANAPFNVKTWDVSVPEKRQIKKTSPPSKRLKSEFYMQWFSMSYRWADAPREHANFSPLKATGKCATRELKDAQEANA